MKKKIKDFLEYKEKTIWYFEQEWAITSYSETLENYLKKCKKQDEALMKIEDLIWDSWISGSSVQNAAYFLQISFKKDF